MTLDNNTAPGAAKIAASLQPFERLFSAAQRGELPPAPLPVSLTNGEEWEIEAAPVICDTEAKWFECGLACRLDGRDLTKTEAAQLEMTVEFLDLINASWNGSEWFDLAAMNQSIEAEALAAEKRFDAPRRKVGRAFRAIRAALSKRPKAR